MPETLNLPEVELRQVGSPETDAGIPVMLTDKTMQDRLQRILARMQAAQLDSLVFWCDLEHGSNFEYLTGFLTRFEEGLLVLKSDGDACLILGNENLKLGVHSRLKARVIHCPYFSLPNQPMDGERSLAEIFPFETAKSAEDIVMRKLEKQEMHDLIGKCLNERETFVVTKRFGLDGEEKQTLTEVSESLRLSRERVILYQDS